MNCKQKRTYFMSNLNSDVLSCDDTVDSTNNRTSQSSISLQFPMDDIHTSFYLTPLQQCQQSPQQCQPQPQPQLKKLSPLILPQLQSCSKSCVEFESKNKCIKYSRGIKVAKRPQPLIIKNSYLNNNNPNNNLKEEEEEIPICRKSVILPMNLKSHYQEDRLRKSKSCHQIMIY